MSTTITAGTGGTSSPILVLGYATARTSRNETLDLISGGIAVVLRAPRPRSGVIEFLFDVEADAFAALDMHAEETTFALDSDERPTVNMTYVVDGDVTLTLDEETRDVWTLAVPYQEVT